MERALSRLTRSAALALALLLPAPAAWAQAAPAPSQGATLLPGASSHEPINIAADKLDYFDKDKKAVYTGNVVAVQGDTRLNATVLTILFENKRRQAAARETRRSAGRRSGRRQFANAAHGGQGADRHHQQGPGRHGRRARL